MAQQYFIKVAAGNAARVKKLVKTARQDVISKGKKANDGDNVVVTSENKRVPDQKLKVVDLATAKKRTSPSSGRTPLMRIQHLKENVQQRISCHQRTMILPKSLPFSA